MKPEDALKKGEALLNGPDYTVIMLLGVVIGATLIVFLW